jgi:hypothetical protein
MNRSDAVLYGLAALAIIAAAGWMITIWVRLRALERAVLAIVKNTDALGEIVKLLRSVDGNTSLLGGIRGVFGARDPKKPR